VVALRTLRLVVALRLVVILRFGAALLLVAPRSIPAVAATGIILVNVVVVSPNTSVIFSYLSFQFVAACGLSPSRVTIY